MNCLEVDKDGDYTDDQLIDYEGVHYDDGDAAHEICGRVQGNCR